MPGSQITFGVGFNVNESGLNKLKQSLQEIQKMTAKDLFNTGNFSNLQQAENELKKIQQSAAQVQRALNSAFNANLGVTNIAKFNSELQKLNINAIAQQFNSAGTAGRTAFNNLATSILTSNTNLKQTYSLLENMKTTLTNTIKWNIASGAINGFTRSIQSAFNYVKALDSSLTDIRIVTGQSRDEMAQFAVQANSAAQALGRQTKEYTNAALAYYQQGLGDAEVQARTEATLKAQNVTGAGTEMANYLTAVWNGFQVTTENTEKYVDKLAAVADSSASNLSELAVGMSKVASTANAMGVDMDQLTAQLATIIATTRQAPETVGNALKTIYARINDIKTGSDEAEISLGNYTSKMAALGFSVLDANGKLKDTGETMEEIGNRWGTLTREQQIYLAQTMAGQRQMNNLIALFDNWQKYSDMLNVSLNAEGALNEKNSRYMESLGAHLKQLQAASEGLQGTLIDEDAIIKVVDAGTKLVNLFNTVLTSIGGVKTASIALGGVLLNTFSSNIANGITNFITNLQNASNNAELLAAKLKVIQEFSNVQNNGLITQLTAWSSQITKFQQAGVMSDQDAAALNNLMQQYNALENQRLAWEEAKAKAEAYYRAIGEGTLDVETSNTKLQATQEQAINAQEKGLKRIQSTLEQNLRLIERTQQAEARYNSNVANTKNFETLINRQRELREQLTETLKEFEQLYNTKGQSLGLSLGKEELENIRTTIGELRNDLNSDTSPQDYAQRYFQALQSIVEKARQAAQETRETLRQGAEGTAQDVRNSMQSIEAAITQSLRTAALKQTLQGFTGILSSVTSIIAGMRSLFQLTKIAQDDTLSFTEKFTQSISAFSMGMVMLINGLTRFGQSLSMVKEGLIAHAAAQGIAAARSQYLAAMTAANAIEDKVLAAEAKNAAAAAYQHAAAMATEGAAAKGTTVLMKELGASIWGVIKPLAPLLIAIAAVSGAIYAFYLIATKEDRKLKEMQEQAEESANKYKELKSSYDELKQSLEDYHAAKDALSELTKGTEEWKEQIEEINQQVLSLLEKYPQLAKYIKKDAQGNYFFDEEGLQEFDKEQRQELARQNITQYVDKLRNNQQEQIANDIEPVAKSFRRAGLEYIPDNSALVDVIELYQTFDAKLREQVRHAANAAEALNQWEFDAEDVASILQLNHGLTEEDFENLGMSLDQFSRLIRAYGNEFVDLLESGGQYTELRKIYSTEIAKALNQSAENQDYLQSAYQATIDSYVSTVLAAQNYSDDAMKQIQEHLSEYVQRVESVFSGVDDETITTALNSFFKGSGTPDLSNVQLNDFDRIFNILSENFTMFGYHTGEEWSKVWKQAEEAANNTINEVGSNFEQASISGFNLVKQQLIESQTASVKNVQQLEQLYRQAFKDSSLLGTDALTKLFLQLGNKTDDFLAQLANTSSLEELLNLFKDFNIDNESLDGFDRLLYSLRNLLNLGQEAPQEKASDFTSVTTNYREAKDIVGDLHYRDAISSDDYNTLIAYNAAIADFFKINNQGEYELTQSAKELNQIVDNINTEQLRNGLEDVTNQITTLETVLDHLDAINNTELSTDPDIFAENQIQQESARTRAEYAVSMGGAGNLDAYRAQAILDMLNDHKLLTPEDLEALNSVKLTAEDIRAVIEGLQTSAEHYKNAMDSRHEFDEDAGSIEDIEKRAEFLKEYGGEVYNLSKDLQDSLKNNHEAAMLIAEDFLRAEAAAENVEKNIDKWRQAFDDPTEDIGTYIESLEEAENAYKDLLNLDNRAHLSDSFLESAENLKLMEQAIQGGVEGLEAYEQLADAAQRDLLDQGIKNYTEGNAELEIPATIDIESLENDLMTKINMAESSIDDIEIGTALDDANFIAGLNEIINAAGMTADQATALLASMGIDADVVEGPPEDTSAPASFSYYKPPVYKLEQQGMMTDATGGQIPFIAPTIAEPGQIMTESGSQTNTSPSSFAIHVENAKKGVGSGGNINRTKAASGGGGGGNKGKKGGGGGGGNKAPKKKDPIKKFKAKIDPYHDVNIKIGDTQEALDKLGKQRNKLIGKDAVDNLTKQIDLMEQEKDLLKEKNAIAQSELDRQAKELANLGAIFEKNGDIANYKQLLLDKQNQVNNAIAVANGLVGDERDAYEKYVNQLKDEYKELEDAIKEYDETMQLMDDLSADYQDLIDKQIELAIEAFDLEINVKLDLKDAEKEFNEFRKKVIDEVKDDQYGGLAEAAARNYSSYYNVDNRGNVGGIIPDLRQHAQDVQREIQIMTNGGWSQIYGDNLAAAADDLKKYNDELMDALEEAQDVIDETHDHFLDAIDAMDEAFDTQQDNLDKIDDLLTHDMEILQLIHGEENFDEMDRLWQQQINQDNTRLEALQAEQKYWQDRLKDYEEGTDEWKKAMENWQDAFEKTNEAMMTSIENLQSKWENSINSIMSSLRNATYGGNMDAALEDWDKLTWHSDRYLDSLERANGLLDLQHNYIDAINATNDPKLQQKLADLEEKQLEALSNKEHIREIDLQIAQQQLTVLQAQMALEDAQQAKTKLRLRRDSQGNYTYQYVADEDDIAEKTQEYAKALADYREMVKNSLHEDLQDLSDYTQEFYDKMQEAQMKYGDDTKALMAEQERLYELYMGEDGYITRLAKDAQSSMQDYQTATFTQAMGLNSLLEEDLFNKFLGPDSEMRVAINDLLGAGGEIPSLIDSFINDSALVAFDTISEATKKTLSGPEGLLPEWQSALWTIADTYDTDFVPRVINAMNYLQQANQSYVNGLAIMQQAANRTTEQIALGLAYDTAYTNALDEATKTLLTTQDAQLSKAEKVYESLKKNEQAFKDQSEAAIDAANAMFLYWLSLNGQTASGLPYSLEGVTPNIRVTTPTIVSNQPSYTGSSYGDDGGGGGSSGNSGNTGGGSKPASTTPRTTSSYGGNRDSSAYWAAAYDRSRLATGGYTGEWNDEPRLAWLDQKELVLNSDDTKNILDSVNIVRTIADRVTAMTGAAAASMSATSAAGLMSTIGQTILQDVIINADFPAVQDAAQIKQAFNELVNLASQRASTNRRA